MLTTERPDGPVRADPHERARAAWSVVRHYLDTYGITRVADVTHLDVIGLPVFVAVRPAGHVFSISQGKGRTTEIARVSAVMESIESWHAEQLPPRSVEARASELDLAYDPSTLPGASGLFARHRPLSWYPATGLLSGAPTWVPTAYLDLSVAAQADPGRGFRASSNGLAAGVNRHDAVAHGLSEVIERHAVSALHTTALDHREHVDLAAGLPPTLDALVRLLEQARAWLELTRIPAGFGGATFVAYLWSEELPRLVGGSGCAVDPAHAAAAAVMEAVQSRLAIITGTREDAPAAPAGRGAPRQRPSHPSPTTARSFAELVEQAPPSAQDTNAIAEAVMVATGHEPLVADLSVDRDVHVVRVIAPGLTFTPDINLPRSIGGPR